MTVAHTPRPTIVTARLLNTHTAAPRVALRLPAEAMRTFGRRFPGPARARLTTSTGNNGPNGLSITLAFADAGADQAIWKTGRSWYLPLDQDQVNELDISPGDDFLVGWSREKRMVTFQRIG